MSAPSAVNVLEIWRFDATVTAGLAFSAVLYLSMARRAGRGRRWPLRRTGAFMAGLAAIAVALESGLDVYDDQLLSIHMVQHLVLVLIAAPLLLAGAPVTLALRALPTTDRQALARVLRGRVVRTLSRPWLGLLVFGATMLSTHLTPLYALALRNNAVHDAEHVLYLVSGLLFWAVLIPPGPVARPLDGLGQVVYLLLGTPLMSVVGVILETGASPRYHQYVIAARGLGISALSDQRLAGTIMWLAGTTAMGALALALAWRSMLAEDRLAVRREAYAERRDGSETGADGIVEGSR